MNLKGLSLHGGQFAFKNSPPTQHRSFLETYPLCLKIILPACLLIKAQQTTGFNEINILLTFIKTEKVKSKMFYVLHL